MNDAKMVATIFSTLFLCIAATAITGIIIRGMNSRYCKDSVNNLTESSTTLSECTHGATAELQKIDGKNILICHCPETKK